VAESLPTDDVYTAAATAFLGYLADHELDDAQRADVAFAARGTPLRQAVAAAYAAALRIGYGQGRDDEANGEDLPEWYRLATGETCRSGQPYACGDYHNAGHCVRRTEATP
jgi:hypothetical protein